MCPTCQTLTECPTHETTACLPCQNQTLESEQCQEESTLSVDNKKLKLYNHILYVVIAAMAATIVGLAAGLIYYKRLTENNCIKAGRRSDLDIGNPGES